MNRIHRTLLSAVVIGGLGGGAAIVAAASFSDVPSAQPMAEHWRYEHMHRALQALREARRELDTAQDIFRGHKAEALGHVDGAIKEAEEGLREQHDEAATPTDLPQRRELAERYEHVHRALELLHQARTELDSADHVFSGHRDRAMEHTDHAIRQLEEAVRDAER
jgi:hypothetical protein